MKASLGIIVKKRMRREGNVAVMVAVMMVVLVGITALAVDVGFIMVTKNEVQNIADAAALAGAGQIGNDYESLPSYKQQENYVCNRAKILSIVQDVAEQNQAGGLEGITIRPQDMIVGQWDPDATPRFTPTNQHPNAVSVTVRRDSGANGPITTFFARIFDIDSVDVSARATAVLTGQRVAPPGTLDLPVGISSQWFNEHLLSFCDQPIKMYPTNSIEGCAGWSTFELGASTKVLREILQGLLDNSVESPEVIAGETHFEFTGGKISPALKDLKNLYDAKKDAQGRWEVPLPVYSGTDCSNPSGSVVLVGFVKAYITEVVAPPDGAMVLAQVVCEAVEPGRGGERITGLGEAFPGWWNRRTETFFRNIFLWYRNQPAFVGMAHFHYLQSHVDDILLASDSSSLHQESVFVVLYQMRKRPHFLLSCHDDRLMPSRFR